MKEDEFIITLNKQTKIWSFELWVNHEPIKFELDQRKTLVLASLLNETIFKSVDMLVNEPTEQDRKDADEYARDKFRDSGILRGMVSEIFLEGMLHERARSKSEPGND